nr:diacylglycerol kinase family protein [Imhoffiella purpurea]
MPTVTDTEPFSTPPGSRILAVINPASGDADPSGPDPVMELLSRRLDERGVQVQRIPFEPDGLAGALSEALDEQVSAICVAGGDGTLLGVVEALDGRRVPLGIVPRGTMNWMAKDLGIPLDLEAAVETLLDARVRYVDTARVNGAPFLCACMIGVSPLVARQRERERGSAPWSRWPRLVWQGLRLLRLYPHRRMRLIADGRSRRLRSHTVVVTNNLLETASGPLPRRTHLDAGRLGIYAVRKTSARDLIRLLTRVMLGDWLADDAVLTTAASEASLGVSGRRAISLMLDGEIRRLETPLRFSVEPRSVAMLVPAT